MYKLIDSSSFFDHEDLQVTLLNAPGSIDALVKSAADDRVRGFVTESLKPEPGKLYLHINAMGAGEYYGANRNGDYFPEETLKQYHHTFVTSPAHVFRHHINKDPAKAIGRVIFSTYNERMHRVELIAEVDRELGKDVEDRIAKGDFPATSMACKTPYDVCSICNNKAHTRLEYCTHIRQSLGKVLPDGQKVMALNVAPLKFFDISIVIKPADITSSILQKVAESGISSAELAEVEGLDMDAREKAASHHKLSEFIKEVEGYVVGSSPNLEGILASVQDPNLADLAALKDVPLEDLLGSLAELGISPSLKFLAELIAHRVGVHQPGIGDQVVQTIRDHGMAGIPPIQSTMDKPKSSELVKKAVAKYQDDCSLFEEFIEKRAYAGYSGMGPRILPTPEEAAREQRMANPIAQAVAQNPITTLLSIAGAAIWAKAYINSMIEEKLREKALAHAHIVKMAAAATSVEVKRPSSITSLRDKVSIGAVAHLVNSSVPNSPAAKAIRTATTLNKVIKAGDSLRSS